MRPSSIIRCILYVLYIPFIIALLLIFKRFFNGSSFGGPIGSVYDIIFNPSLVLDLINKGEIDIHYILLGVNGFFICFFLPLDLIFLKVKNETKVNPFLILFSVPVLINTVALAVAGYFIIKSFGEQLILSVIWVCVIHIIRVLNMYINVLKNNKNSDIYLGSMWLCLGFFYADYGDFGGWNFIFVGVGFVIALICYFVKKEGRPYSRIQRCPNCRKIVLGESQYRVIGTCIDTDTWKTKEKWGEIKDEYGNKIDVYQDVEHSKDVKRTVCREWYTFQCPKCGETWTSKSWESKS